MKISRKKYFYYSLFIFLLSAVPFSGFAQSVTALRINEVLVINEDNFQDDYGAKNSWVELFNTSAATVDIGGCFLTNDLNNPQKYPIPGGDVKTKIPPKQHILFWADNSPHRGTFHVNFELDPDGPNFIALFSSDGRTLIDSVTIPANQVPDISYGRPVDGKEGWAALDKVTPDTNNLTLDKNIKVENLKKNDPDGVAITLISMSVVFLALLVAFIIYKLMGNYFTRGRSATSKVKDMSDSGIKPIARATSDDDATYAAIAMAMYELFESGYEKHGQITISPMRKTYSPWSSKIQTMRRNPR